ncbi:MAG: hypothetical protein ACRD2J_09475 [Thermoanaerobaculia bacterium]
MFAINHAATALLVKRRYPAVPMVAALLSVQLVELIWVALHYAGIERTVVDPVVRSVGDIHLVHMPYSHSVATTILLAALAWGIGWMTGRRTLGAALALGIASHLVLDLATHDRDIAIAPFTNLPEIGTMLYAAAPGIAFVLELAWGIFCWRVYRGSVGLLTAIALFNLANVSMFFAAIPGPEQWFANQPMLLVTAILVQIVVTLAVVGVLARSRNVSVAAADAPAQ